MAGPSAGGAGGAPGGMQMAAGPGGAMAGGGMAAPGGAMAGGGGEAAASSGGRRSGGGMGIMSQLSEEDQKKFRDAMQKALAGKSLRDLSPEERTKVMQAAAKAVPAAAKMMQAMAAAGGAGGPGGFMGGRPSQFSEKDLENAKLPTIADSESQLDVLLRPGLLADVEIILEKIPNAIHIPNQAVFEKDGKQIVYLRRGKGWEEREIKPMKRSESVMVIAGGVKPGDTIAMSDPFAKPGDKKKKEKSSGGPAGSMPAGGGRS